jgi:hypothetical protein
LQRGDLPQPYFVETSLWDPAAFCVPYCSQDAGATWTLSTGAFDGTQAGRAGGWDVGVPQQPQGTFHGSELVVPVPGQSWAMGVVFSLTDR